MIPKQYFIAILFFTAWISSCKQSGQSKSELVPGDMKAAVALLNDTSTARLSIWKDTTGTAIKVFGKNWFSNINGEATVMIILNEDTIDLPGIKYNSDGSFLADLPRLYLKKTYTLKVTQQNEKGEHKEATIDFNI